MDTKRNEGPLDLSVKGETISVLEGLETIHGMDCVRIKSDKKSTVEGSGNTMGQDIKITGDKKTTSTSFFACKRGTFVKRTVEKDSTMKINLGAMGEMPQTVKETTTIELVK